MISVLKKLNWGHIALIALLPIILALINPNWLFNLSFRHQYLVLVDDYIYTGYQWALPQYIGWNPSDSHYFIERINWILTGYVMNQLFSPLVAHLIIHFALYYFAIFSIYGIANKLSNARVALIMALLFGQYPLIMRSLGWNYTDGYSMTWAIFSLLLMTYASQSSRRPLYLMGAGASFALMVTAHFFNAFYAPALAIYFLLLDGLYKHPVKLVKTGVYVLIGAGVLFGIQALAYYGVTGKLLFANSVEVSGIFVDTLAPFLKGFFAAGVTPYWHIFLAVVAFLGIRLLFRRSNTLSQFDRQKTQAVIGGFLGAYGVILIWWMGDFYYTHLSFYHANVILFAFLVLVVFFADIGTRLNNRQYKIIVGVTYFVPLLPMLILTFSGVVFSWSLMYGLLIIASAGCALYLVSNQRPLSGAMVFIVLMIVSSLMIGDSPFIRIYNSDRYQDQSVYEETHEIAQVINEIYPSLSFENFHFLYDFTDYKLPTFHAVSAVYLWTWGRKERLNDNGIVSDEILATNSIIVLSSISNRPRTLSMLSKAGFNFIDNEIVLDDITLLFFDMTVFKPDTFHMRFNSLQRRFVLEESGWNGYEGIASTNPFRWTAEPTARLLIDATDANFTPQKMYQIGISVVSSLEEEVVNSLKFSINGESISLTREGNWFVGMVDGLVLNSPTLELIFETDRVSNPFDLGIQDGRKLGVAISEFTIVPIAEGE